MNCCFYKSASRQYTVYCKQRIYVFHLLESQMWSTILYTSVCKLFMSLAAHHDTSSGCLASMFDNKYPSITESWVSFDAIMCGYHQHVNVKSQLMFSEAIIAVSTLFQNKNDFGWFLSKIGIGKLLLAILSEEEEKWNISKLDLTKLFLCG